MYGFSKIYFLFATETNQEKEVSNGGGGGLNIIAIKFIHLTVATCISMKSTAMEKEDYLYVR